jgi:hypothetical protein
MTNHPDFSVVVKNRGRLPSPWKWEIYRAGRNSPIKQSEVYFSTVTEANRAGKKALSLFLSEYHDEASDVRSPSPRSNEFKRR